MGRGVLAAGTALAGAAILAVGIIFTTGESEDSTTFLRIWWTAVFAVPGVALLVVSLGLWRARRR